MSNRIVFTAEELAALPFGSVVVGASGTPRTKVRGNTVYTGSGWASGDTSPITNEMLADGRALWVVYEKGEALPELIEYSQNLYQLRSKTLLMHEAHFPVGYMPPCPVWGIWLDDPTENFGSHRAFFEEGATADEAVVSALARYSVEGVSVMRGVAPFLASETVRATILNEGQAAA
ncbi:hypothetical protein GCM10025867_47970 (plasmid) [Frondihabitans sucicola]|uniref:Uncharacterized protein n=1 Tax=Frondihabitans sucicola TaxID=1268041 RepID=A0ABM8GVQ4_9MICO|nr:hypothetical protein [Frondihabitans sucicola]BDZ52556.1 hypothetical protein GCM10025867_47970 [Frondihabitans sucicola]